MARQWTVVMTQQLVHLGSVDNDFSIYDRYKGNIVVIYRGLRNNKYCRRELLRTKPL